MAKKSISATNRDNRIGLLVIAQAVDNMANKELMMGVASEVSLDTLLLTMSVVELCAESGDKAFSTLLERLEVTQTRMREKLYE